jgi:hypothetical protein
VPNDPELRRVLEKVVAASAINGPALKPYPPAISDYIAHTGDHPYMVAFAIFAAIAEYRSWPPAEDPAAGAQYERLRQHWPTPAAWVRKLLSAETDAEAVAGVTWAHSYLTWMHRYSAMDPSAALWMPPVTPPAADHHPESRPTVAAIDQSAAYLETYRRGAATLAGGPTLEPESPDPAGE